MRKRVKGGGGSCWVKLVVEAGKEESQRQEANNDP